MEDGHETDLTLDKLRNALKKKNCKAPGEDGIPAELLKNIRKRETSWFLELCVEFWNEEEIPDNWGKILSALYTRKWRRKLMPPNQNVYEKMLEAWLRKP